MPLIYALIARGNVVLVEHAESEGNFPTVTRLLLCRIPLNRQRMSYIYDSYAFHYSVVDGLTFLAMADESVGFALPFAFLEECKNHFLPRFKKAADSGIALSLQSAFEGTLSALLTLKPRGEECLQERFNSVQTADSFRQIRSQIDGIQNVMIDNIDKILQRGERIDLLVDRADQLNQEAVTFRRQVRTLLDFVSG